MLKVVEEAARTDTGRQRTANEDAYFARAPVYVVADGMGGAQAGEVAAGIATSAFEDGLREGESTGQELARIASDANRRIFELARSDSTRSGMGTTLTSAALSGDEVTIVHVGDSRAYILRGGELRQLTRDHSLVEELRRQGRLTEEEAEDHPQRSIITRALGPEQDVDLDVQTHQARSGDVFLLCSDGLTSMLREERLHQILQQAGSLQQAVDELIAEANERGGRDNITAILFRLGNGDGAAHDDDSGGTGEHTLTALDADTVAAAAATAEPEAASSDQEAATAEPKRAAAPRPEPERPRPDRRRRRRRLRLVLALVAVLVVVAVLVIAAVAVARNVYFVGHNERGLVTLYRGLPYELPAGIELYDTQYVSPVQARRLRPFERRRLFDHELRSREDAAELIRDLERGR